MGSSEAYGGVGGIRIVFVEKELDDLLQHSVVDLWEG